MEKTVRKEYILACAKKVFAERGYHSTSISNIIERAEIARGTFYLYFTSKRDILNEILENIITSIKNVIVKIDPEKDVFEQLRTNVTKIISILFGDSDIPKILFNEAVGLDKGFDNRLKSFYHDISSIIKDSLELGISMGIVRQLNTHLLSFAALGTVKEVVFQKAVTGSINIDTDKLIDEILSFVLHGILVKW